MKHDFDVIVIGGGHAGTEAAYASARLGVRTCLVTQRFDRIGEMSCNPAIGGLGKGHLVREIDALGGIMGEAADFAGIQFRLLNRSKGPAVRGPRAQADRARYKSFVQTRIGAFPNLHVLEGEVVDFLMNGSQLCGVLLADGSEVRALGCVLTTGTFLNGIIHIGEQKTSGGRIGDPASCLLAERVNDMGLPLGRLKTGTPPRLISRSIDWDQVEMQPGDEVPELFSFLSTQTQAEQISCGITHTNAHTHEIIEKNLSRSAMYGGHIDGVGPRYCPSIEDKVVRFAEKESHQVFLEPESLSSDVIYPNGISTSLPQDVQEAYVRTIRGLEHAEIVQPGYAIEYDYVDPRSLDRHLRLEACEGLYLAGQINGTTGYEEAAAQGLVAGLSAALCVLGRDPVAFARHSSYIGVLIDDLTTRGVSEPYRMFTSRAEFRLSLRADNADQRLTPLGTELGIISKERKELFQARMEQIESARKALEGHSLTPNEALGVGIQLNQDGVHRDGIDLLSRKDVSVSTLCGLWNDLAEFGHDILEQIKRDAQYTPYIERQRQEMEALRRDETIAIPKDFDYAAVPGLSNELKQKLSQTKPDTIAAAGRIDGVTPAALAVVLLHIKRLAA